MNRKNRVVVLAVFGLFLMVLCIFSAIQTYVFVSPHMGVLVTLRPPDPLEAQLNKLVTRYKNGEVSSIDISTITTFPWDNLYLFGSYTEHSDVASIFGPFWYINNPSNCNEVLGEISTSDTSTLLVFSNKGTVIHCFAYEKESYYLMVPDSQKKPGYSPQEALFVLDNEGRMVLKGTE